MSRRHVVAALLAASCVPALAGAQRVYNSAAIYERTGDFLRYNALCGTGVDVAAGVLPWSRRPMESAGCAGGEVFTDATGGVLRFRAALTGEGVTEPLFEPPYASGLGNRVGRVAQVSIGFDDVLTAVDARARTARLYYDFTGTRAERTEMPPAGAAPTDVFTRAAVNIFGEDEFVGSFDAPLGTSDIASYLDVPLVGGSTDYSLFAGGFVRLTTSLTSPVFALVGGGAIEFASSLHITRIAALDEAGVDITTGAGLSSRVFDLAPDGTVTGGRVVATPEPATVALMAGGLTLLGVATARRRRG